MLKSKKRSRFNIVGNVRDSVGKGKCSDWVVGQGSDRDERGAREQGAGEGRGQRSVREGRGAWEGWGRGGGGHWLKLL